MKRLLLLLLVPLTVWADPGLLRWDGSTRYYTDGNGKPVFLAGHYWFAVPTYTATFGDYALSNYVSVWQANNYNFARLWNVEQVGGDRVVVYPWPRSGPGNAADGLLKWDLQSFDSNYFSRVTNILAAAKSNGVYCSIMLWNPISMGATQRFATNLHYTVNNINSHVTITNNWYTLTDATWAGFMSNYVSHAVDAFNPYPNFIWEVWNEAGPQATNFGFSFAQELARLESTKTYQHPIVISGFSGSLLPDANSYITRWIATSNVGSAFIPMQGGDANDYSLSPPLVSSAYPAIIDTDHIFGQAGNVSNTMKVVTRGYGGYWDLDTTNNNPGFTTLGASGLGLGRIKTLVNLFDLSGSKPSNSVSSTGYAITNGIGQVLTASFNKTSFTVNHPAGALQWLWLDPDVGTLSGTQDGRTKSTYTASSTSDSWVVPSGFTTQGLLLIEKANYGPGIQFGGGTTTGDRIDCGGSYTNSMTNNITFVAWINVDSPNMHTQKMSIVSNEGFYFWLDNTRLDLGNNATDVYGATNAIQDSGQVYHVAATRDGSGNYKFYVNGSRSGPDTNQLGSASPTGNVIIGNDPATANKGFKGLIWGVQIYNRVLPATEILALYRGNYIGPINPTSLLAYYPMTDHAVGTALDGLTIADRSKNRANGTAHKGASGVMTQNAGSFFYLE